MTANGIIQLNSMRNIRRSDIILIYYATFVPNFVFFATSIAELAHGEKLRTQSLTHPAYLMPRNRSESFGKKLKIND